MTVALAVALQAHRILRPLLFRRSVAGQVMQQLIVLNIDIEDTGYSVAESDLIIEGLSAPGAYPADDVPAAGPAVTKSGDLWSLGRDNLRIVAVESAHRLGIAAQTHRGVNLIPLVLPGSIMQMEARGQGLGLPLQHACSRLSQCDVSLKRRRNIGGSIFQASRQRRAVLNGLRCALRHERQHGMTRVSQKRYTPPSPFR
jgi:hypothetical protein